LQKVWYANAVIVAVVAFLAVAASLAAVQAVIAAGRILAWVVGIGAADYLPDRYRALVAVAADIPVDRIGTLVAVAADILVDRAAGIAVAADLAALLPGIRRLLSHL